MEDACEAGGVAPRSDDAQDGEERTPPRVRRGQKAGCRKVQWSKTRKAIFLDHLAATCNVSAAAEAAGVLPGSVYQLRRRDAAFAAGWGEALAAGYAMLETQLVGHALSGGGARRISNGDVAHTGAIDVSLALQLLSTHRDRMLGKPSRGGRTPRTATAAETNAALLKRLRVVEARRVAPQADPLALPLPAADAGEGVPTGGDPSDEG